MRLVSSDRWTAARGFTLIELLVVVVIIGTLAAIAIPNFLSMSSHAREGSLKSNMHTFQLAAEDYATQHQGEYATGGGGAALVAAGLRLDFKNPFTRASGSGGAWMDGTADAPGLVGYDGVAGDDSTTKYTISGYGANAPLSLRLLNGQSGAVGGGVPVTP